MRLVWLAKRPHDLKLTAHQHQDPTPDPHRVRLPLPRGPHRPRHARPRRPPTRPTRPPLTPPPGHLSACPFPNVADSAPPAGRRPCRSASLRLGGSTWTPPTRAAPISNYRGREPQKRAQPSPHRPPKPARSTSGVAATPGAKRPTDYPPPAGSSHGHRCRPAFGERIAATEDVASALR